MKFSRTFVWSSSQDGITSPPISHYTRINNNNCETRHCSVGCVGCPLYSDTQLSYSWLLAWETPCRQWPGQSAPRPTLPAEGRPDHQRHGRHPPSNLESSVSHFSHKPSLFSCNRSQSSPRQDPISSHARHKAVLIKVPRWNKDRQEWGELEVRRSLQMVSGHFLTEMGNWSASPAQPNICSIPWAEELETEAMQRFAKISQVDVKLGCQHKGHKRWAGWLA